MLSRIETIVLMAASASVLCLASDDLKPACDAGNAGRLWPDAANHDSRLRKKFSRCGELEICKHGRIHYRWQSVTVRLDQLRGGSQLPKPSACEAPPDAAQEENHVGPSRVSPSPPTR
ncbi:MAG TPA: hypothetical protein VGP62_12235 [Bryobacteraceae bacterium]|jgi:hypothetical protein|nr:hypothetical protein [Bryobacteraceae bacterium]